MKRPHKPSLCWPHSKTLDIYNKHLFQLIPLFLASTRAPCAPWIPMPGTTVRCKGRTATFPLQSQQGTISIMPLVSSSHSSVCRNWINACPFRCRAGRSQRTSRRSTRLSRWWIAFCEATGSCCISGGCRIVEHFVAIISSLLIYMLTALYRIRISHLETDEIFCLDMPGPFYTQYTIPHSPVPWRWILRFL